MLGQDPQENVQQEEYNDYTKSRTTGKDYYLPLDKKETMRTGKTVNLKLPLTDFLGPSGFTERYKGYDPDTLHHHLLHGKRMNINGLLNFKWDSLSQNVATRSIIETTIGLDHIHKFWVSLQF